MPSLVSSFRWEPLPKILYGFSVHPFVPDVEPGFPEDSVAAAVHANLISLEVGDEVYVFEQLGHVSSAWYRGYVVSTHRQATAATSMSSLSDYSAFPPSASSSSGAGLVEEPQVYVGIFPSSHVHIREQLDDAEMRLQEMYERAKEQGIVGGGLPPRSLPGGHMEPVIEEEEEEGDEDSFSQQAVATASGNSDLNRQKSTHKRVSMDARRQSLTLPSSSEDSERPPPPLPSLKCGDETYSGLSEPLVDEIACALREWSSLMYSYLSRRDYALFHIVRRHIEVLHMSRRQLLTQTLSAEEVGKLRRECVARLVKGNVAQGLDVIVRHPGRGGLVDVDLTGKESDPESWVSGIRLYALQVALAYVDQPPDGQGSSTGSLVDLATTNAFGITSPSTTNPLLLEGGNSPSRSRRTSRPSSSGRSSGSSGLTGVKYYHVYLDLRAFVASPCAPGETAELYFSLYNKADGRFLTEEYCVVLNHQGVPAREAEGRIGKVRTLFTDLLANDMHDLNVVCRIIKNGSMRVNGGASPYGPTDARLPVTGGDEAISLQSNSDHVGGYSPSNMLLGSSAVGTLSYRRPFGCAVLELGQHHQIIPDVNNASSMREHGMPIFVPVHEAAFSTLHQQIIASRIKEFEKSPKAEMLAISIKVFHGEADTIIRENPSLLQDAPLTARLGFPDVVVPGDKRNEVYIKLWSGNFQPSKGVGSQAQLNVQVSAEVRTRDGHILENVISRGTGEPNVTQFDSSIYYHQNNPTWGELIKLTVPVELMEQCHVFFTFRHRSSKQTTGQNPEKPFAHAYLPLFEDNQAFIPDGTHHLLLWKVNRPQPSIAPELYFEIPPVAPPGSNNDVPGPLSPLFSRVKDTMLVRTLLVSTKYTQNETLLRLLNWEKIGGGPDELRDVLSKFVFVGEVEVVKFLRDVFDALFGIMTSPYSQAGDIDDLVFNALVTVLGIVSDRRFQNFRATLDVYIERHYTSATAYLSIMHSMARLLADPGNPASAQSLRSAIKVWPYLFKLMLRSRDIQRAKEIGGGTLTEHLDAEFKRDLEGLLRDINRLMAATKPSSIIGTQTLALQHFAGILPDLATVFNIEELVDIATSFTDSIFITKGKMVIWKLMLILQMAKGVLFEHRASRSMLIPSVIRWIRPHIGRYDELSHTSPNDLESVRDGTRITWIEGTRLCVTILAIILDRVQSSLQNRDGINDAKAVRQEQDNVDYILSMMPRLLDAYREMESPATIKTIERHRSPSTMASFIPVIFPSSYPFPLIAKPPSSSQQQKPVAAAGRRKRKENHDFLNCGLGEVAAVLIVLIMLSPRKHLAGFLDEQMDIEGKAHLAQFLTNYFQVMKAILSNEAYPSSWLNINILAHKMTLKMAEPIGALLVREFIPDQNLSYTFDTTLWRHGLEMLLHLLASDQLVIEEFKPQRRRAVWRLAGDIRGEGAGIFATLWNAIGWPEAQKEDEPARLNTGGYQVQFVPTLVELVLELCLSHHDALRSVAVQVLATMITSEWHLNGNFRAIEAEIIDRLDVLFITDTKGDEISRAFFIGQLRALFDSPQVDPNLREQVHACLVSVNRFLDLLLSVRSLPLEEGYEDDRVAGTLKLLGFLRQANRVSVFSTHVLRLVNLHLENRNYTEAALTLKLHADLHSWDLNSFVEPIEDLDLPRQSEFARKETLYMLILDYLGKGSAWEISVDICKELMVQYETKSVNYQRLSEVLVHQASLYEKIVTIERYFPSYFRVGYFGLGWPGPLQNKMFVYRGFELEKYAGFCERLLAKHPKAILIKSSNMPGEDVRFANQQFIQVTAVSPEPNKANPMFSNPEVPPSVRSYYEHNATNTFTFTRPLPKANETPMRSAESEFATLWVEKTILRCEDAFPTVLRRSEVAQVEILEISPLENALNDVEAKREELQALEAKYSNLEYVSAPSKINTTRLSMALNGAVDAPVNGGIPMYKRAFFSTDFVSSNPDKVGLIQNLRDAIDAQVRVIDRCIKLHAKLCPAEMRPFHDTLERFFRMNFAEEIKRLSLDDSTSQPPSSPGLPRQSTNSGSVDGASSLDRTASLGTAGTGATATAAATTATTAPNGSTPNRPVRMSEGASLYSVDASNRLTMTSADGVFGSPSIQSPLQRHLAYLTRQTMYGTAPGLSASTSISTLADAEPQTTNAGPGSLGGGTPSATLHAPSTRYEGSIDDRASSRAPSFWSSSKSLMDGRLGRITSGMSLRRKRN